MEEAAILSRRGNGPGESWIQGLKRILGPDRVRESREDLAKYFRGDADTGGLVAAFPSCVEQVQEVVQWAGENGKAVFTLQDRFLENWVSGGKGVVLDFRDMARIARVDKRNLLAQVERGVTFEALKSVLDEQGLKLAAPIGAPTDSVLSSFLCRVPVKKATLYPEVHLYNLQVVLADGRIHRTGSHALNEKEDCREDGGPSLSRWYLGSDDIFGIVTRGVVWLYPKTECRDALLFAAERLEDAVTVLRDVPRCELGWEWLAMNRRYAQYLLGGGKGGDLPPWIVVVGFDHRRKLVEYQKRKVLDLLAGKGLRPVDAEAYRREFETLLDEVWYEGSPFGTGFYCGCDKMASLDTAVRRHVAGAGLAAEQIGHCLLSVNRGRCLYSRYDVFGADGAERVGDLERELCCKGAFFDRPREEVWQEVSAKVENLRRHMRTIKGVVDPKGVLNPGRYVRMDEQGYRAPTPVYGGPGDTGVVEENLAEVEEKLRAVVGPEWVSSNRADLAAYGRDFTIFSGERPNLVVLPASTEEVQGIMRIAYEHRVPVVPLTTGFNHGGLTIPRKGGILVDLKRMNRILRIDEETMTATFEPGVRMRSLWYETHKVSTFQGLRLKPILPLTLGSVSLLSNYVSRGGPGSAVKYGFSCDLTANMTWVLPNGEILRTGPSSVPEVGDLGLNWGPGPDITGMFFNADGAFGICTQITAKLYPDLPSEMILQTAVFDEDPEGCRKACGIMYDVCQDNLVEFIYKSHPGVMCVTLSGIMGGKPQDYLMMSPKHPLFMIVTGMDEEEVQIRAELVREIFARHEVMEFDMSMVPPEFEQFMSTEPMKASLGVRGNTVGSYRGAFQWQAGYIQVNKVPEINQEYKKLIRKYWKTSDTSMSLEGALTGTDIQGPLPYARMGTVEFDYWWDQGNPESVKRAAVMIRKTTEMMFRYGVIPIRNMFGFGELLIPRLEVYRDLLREVRAAFDPANLMHPDVLPVTEDYV